MTPPPKRKLLILTQHRLEMWIAPPWFAERLRRDFPEVEVAQRNSYENTEQHIEDVEVLFGISIRPEQFLAAQKLRWIHSQAAAVHQFMFPELVNSDVIITNARDVHGPVVAEQVLAMIYALAKQIPAAVRFQEKHEWGQDAISKVTAPREIAGTTVGLVGVGSIGRNVAKHAAALGMRVVAVREHPERANRSTWMKSGPPRNCCACLANPIT
jgi:phosphoglycerate dehydrogenase-like enzyme